MKRLITIIMFTITIPGIISATNVPGTSENPVSLKGRIVDAESGRPLVGVHVFLSETTIGTVTDDDGRYELTQVSPGAYRIYISKIGYENIAEDMMLSESVDTLDFEMKPEDVELEEVTVEDKADEDWQRNFKRFKNEFIGTSELADSVEITNREVLNFDRNWWGRLTAEAAEPLEIKNHSLGYNITYHLDEFTTTGTTTKWDGEPLFEEMTPADSQQKEKWEEKREEAFLGSFRHFLLSLINGELSSEGFVMYIHNKDARGNYSQQKRRERRSRLISYDHDKETYKMNFFGKLEIIYTEGEETRRYMDWLRDHNRRHSRSQTSYLELNERPLTIDEEGEILETYGATRYGFFAFLRLADVTPREYRPDGMEDVFPLTEAE